MGFEIECPDDLLPAATAALRGAGVSDGHLSIELVGPERIKELNRRYRGLDEATDVLSFPVDETESVPGPRELGDVVICPEHAADLETTVVHGVLHLAGHDHETDSGEMLELQRRILSELRAGEGAGRP